MNKQPILLTLVFLLVYFSVFSQKISNERSNFKGGVRVGFTASQISGDDLQGFNKFGAYAGGFVNFPISESLRWKIQPEINFTMKGSHSYQSVKNISVNTYSLNLYYIEVPVLIKWNIFKDFEWELGPQLGVSIYAVERDANGIIASTKPFRRFEFSVMTGIAYLIKEHYGLSLRYSVSCIPVRVPDNIYGRWLNKQFNSEILTSFYYQF